MTEFGPLLRALTEANVEFILVGGVAAAAHGAIRLTSDLDVVYRRTPENLERVVAALAPHAPYLRGAPPGLPFRWDVETLRNGLNFTLVTKIGNVDLLGDIAGGGDYERLLPDTIASPVPGGTCRCLTLRKLIATKRAAGRPKDFEAIAELELLFEMRDSDESDAT